MRRSICFRYSVSLHGNYAVAPEWVVPQRCFPKYWNIAWKLGATEQFAETMLFALQNILKKLPLHRIKPNLSLIPSGPNVRVGQMKGYLFVLQSLEPQGTTFISRCLFRE